MKKTKKNMKKSKWSRMFGDLRLGFWNPWSHCNKRHEHVKSLECGTLGLGELHNKHLEDRCKCKQWICSERSEVDEQGCDPDPAAGVAMWLSPMMADRILDIGCVGSRIVCARLAGPVCNLFAIM